MHECRAFDQLVSRRRKQPALGNARRIHTVSGAADPLKSDCNRAWRADLADKVDRADIDSEFERRSRYDSAEFSILQLLFCFESEPARETAVMGKNGRFAQPLGKVMGDAFG